MSSPSNVIASGFAVLAIPSGVLPAGLEAPEKWWCKWWCIRVCDLGPASCCMGFAAQFGGHPPFSLNWGPARASSPRPPLRQIPCRPLSTQHPASSELEPQGPSPVLGPPDARSRDCQNGDGGSDRLRGLERRWGGSGGPGGGGAGGAAAAETGATGGVSRRVTGLMQGSQTEAPQLGAAGPHLGEGPPQHLNYPPQLRPTHQPMARPGCPC